MFIQPPTSPRKRGVRHEKICSLPTAAVVILLAYTESRWSQFVPRALKNVHTWNQGPRRKRGIRETFKIDDKSVHVKKTRRTASPYNPRGSLPELLHTKMHVPQIVLRKTKLISRAAKPSWMVSCTLLREAICEGWHDT